VQGYKFRFLSNLVGEEGSRIQGVKDSRVCFLKTLSALSTFFEGIETTDLLICEVRLDLSSFGNFAVIPYISKQSSYDFC